MNKSEEYTLPRTGQSNLEFTGELLAQAKSPASLKHDRSPTAYCHWFEADVYQTKGGKFILAIRYRWAGKMSRELAQDFATVHADLESCLAHLNEFEPTECVNGYPEGNDKWNEKQIALMNNIDSDFALLVEQIETQLATKTQPAERVE